MKIGIISDTHGLVDAWNKVADEIFRDVDVILHAGDVLYHGPRNPVLEGYNPQELAKAINNSRVPVLIARGNCDAEVDQMLLNTPISAPYLFTFLNGKRVLVHHGHSLPEEMAQLAASWNIDLCISGHTHLAEIKKIKDTVFLNPGSCSLPKGNDNPSVGLWDGNWVYILDVTTGAVINKHQL